MDTTPPTPEDPAVELDLGKLARRLADLYDAREKLDAQLAALESKRSEVAGEIVGIEQHFAARGKRKGRRPALPTRPDPLAGTGSTVTERVVGALTTTPQRAGEVARALGNDGTEVAQILRRVFTQGRIGRKAVGKLNTGKPAYGYFRKS